MEDNLLQERIHKLDINIDRTNMDDILTTKKYMQLNHGSRRILDNKIQHRAMTDDGTDGINTITNINYKIVMNEGHIEVLYDTWNIPTNPKDIKFEILDKPVMLKQKILNINDIL